MKLTRKFTEKILKKMFIIQNDVQGVFTRTSNVFLSIFSCFSYNNLWAVYAYFLHLSPPPVEIPHDFRTFVSKLLSCKCDLIEYPHETDSISCLLSLT